MKRVRLVLLAAVALLQACAAAPDASEGLAVAPGEYAMALDITREVLADYRFTVDRVDAASGVVSSEPKGTSGVLSPWDRDQSDLGDELEDLARPRFRMVRVTFEPASATSDENPVGTPGTGFQPAPDLRQEPGPIVARVQVFVYAQQRPNYRLETESIRRSRTFNDPELVAKRMQPTFLEPEREDPELANRLAAAIRLRLARSSKPG